MSLQNVKGLDDTLALLSTLGENIEKAAIRAGMTAAAAVVRDEARLRAPKGETGKLARAIRSGSPRKREDGAYSITVSVRGNDHAFLGLFFEYGVSPHYITGGDSGLSARKLTQSVRAAGSSDAGGRGLLINGNYVSGEIFHPGFAPRPFLRPALDVKAEEAMQAMATRIANYVESLTGFKAAA